jgi:hypothetical protein
LSSVNSSDRICRSRAFFERMHDSARSGRVRGANGLELETSIAENCLAG